MCGVMFVKGPELNDALAWIADFERLGGRVLCDGVSFAVTMPAEADAVLMPDNLSLVAQAALWRHHQRGGVHGLMLIEAALEEAA